MYTEELYLCKSDDVKFNTSILNYHLNLNGEIIKKKNYINFANNSFPLVSLLQLHDISSLQISIKSSDSFELNSIKSSNFVANGVHIVTTYLNSHNVNDYKKVKQALSMLICANINTANFASKPIMISNKIFYQYYSNPSTCYDKYKLFMHLLPKDNMLDKYMKLKNNHITYMATINISLNSITEMCNECHINQNNRLHFTFNTELNTILQFSQDDVQHNGNMISDRDIPLIKTPPYYKNINLTSYIYDYNINFKRKVYLSNKNQFHNLNISVTETIPNYYELNFHDYTYCIIPLTEVNYTNMSQNSNSCKVLYDYQFTYHGGNDDTYSSISWSISIPANSKIIISSSYIKLFMNFEQYPAESNKGFEIYPMVIRSNLVDSENFHFFTTEASLLSFPIGDFSMPFNAITLISTIFAFLVGSVVNTMVKK